MKNNILVCLLVFLLVFSLCGCLEEPLYSENSDIESFDYCYKLYSESDFDIYVFIDPETNIEYLVYDGYRSGCICIREKELNFESDCVLDESEK